MAIDVRIVDGRGSGYKSRTTSRGELVINKADYSTPYVANATVINTGYNFVPPIAGKRFVITEMLVSTDRNVGATNGALINVYEADSSTETTVSKSIITDLELVKQERIFLQLNMIVSEGKWVNIKTDDNNVRATLWGYYVNA